MANRSRWGKAHVAVMPRRDILNPAKTDGFNVEIEISAKEAIFSSDRVNLFVLVHPYTFDGQQVWSNHLFWHFIGKGWADLTDLDRAQKALKAIHRYLDKLPVSPSTPWHFVKAILAKYRPEEVFVSYFQDEHSPASVRESCWDLKQVEAVLHNIFTGKIPANA